MEDLWASLVGSHIHMTSHQHQDLFQFFLSLEHSPVGWLWAESRRVVVSLCTEEPRSMSDRESSETAEATLLVRPAMEKKRSVDQGMGSGTAGLSPLTPAPTLATKSGPTPTSAVQVDKRVGKGVRAEALAHSPRLQLLVQVLLNQPQVFGT